MSGRIRTVKPELLEDAVTAGLSETAFRLFVGMILLADDFGVLRAEAAYLHGQVFWRTAPAKPVSDTLAEVAQKLVVVYEAGGQSYAAIRNWEKHQKVSHRGKRRLPAPPETQEKASGDPPESLPIPSGESPEILRPDLRPSTIDHRPSPAPEDLSPVTFPTPEGLDGAEAAVWARGIARATGKPCTQPSWSDGAQIAKAMKTHAPGMSGPAAETWLEESAFAFASTENPKFGGFTVRRWVTWENSGRPGYEPASGVMAVGEYAGDAPAPRVDATEARLAGEEASRVLEGLWARPGGIR